MFKSIFSRLIAVFISILLFCLTVTGVILYYFLDNFVSGEKEKALIQSGEEINRLLNEYPDFVSNTVGERTLRYVIKSYEANTNALIWIVRTDGYIIYTEEDPPELGIPRQIRDVLVFEGPGNVRLPDERQYKKVMQNKDIVKERGDFYGLFKSTNMPWLTIEKPLIIQGEVEGAVYFHTPLPKIQEARSTVLKFFMSSVAISVILSIFLVYIFSKRITSPLKQISNAAKVIAGGEFSKLLDIHSQDEIGELAKSFNMMVAALQNLEESRRGFIANVSHELRTPMTSIRGFIEGIMDGTIPAEKHNYYLSVVKDETNRLNRLVNDLLDLAKMEAGEMPMTIKNFNINELLRRCVINLESLIVKKDLNIKADFEEENMYVFADKDAIERVIINLLHNAIKFTPQSGVIRITTARQKDKILISVADNGVGIEPDEIDLIWDRFYKSDKSRSRDKSGTGLGLAIIRNIINEHKQQIWVESELGKGTKFTFTLERGREA